MKYKQGTVIETYSQDGKAKITMHKIRKGYRVNLYEQNINGWNITRQRNAPDKKYAERRFIELIQELKQKERVKG